MADLGDACDAGVDGYVDRHLAEREMCTPLSRDGIPPRHDCCHLPRIGRDRRGQRVVWSRLLHDVPRHHPVQAGGCSRIAIIRLTKLAPVDVDRHVRLGSADCELRIRGAGNWGGGGGEGEQDENEHGASRHVHRRDCRERSVPNRYSALPAISMRMYHKIDFCQGIWANS